MTNTATLPSSDLIGRLSALNEAVLAHEATDTNVWGDKANVADAIGELAAYVHDHAAALVEALGEDAATALRALVWANDAAQTYRAGLHRLGDRQVMHVGMGTALLRAANQTVAAFMNHIDNVIEVLDR